MASGLKYWIGATLALCLIIGVGAVSGGHDLQPPSEQIAQGPGTKWAGEAASFAAQWRTTWVRWRLESYRARMSHAADSARAAGGTAPLLLVDGPSTPEQLAELRKDLGEIWHAAAPEGFKVAVALVIVRDAAAKPGPDTPPLSGDEASTYLFPDSLHRDMCLAVMHLGYTGRWFFDVNRTSATSRTDVLRWLSQGLGPCAFYGAYGVPGREIGRWLRSGGMDLAIYPHWWSSASDPWLRMFYYSYSEGPPSRQPAEWWTSMYSFLPWNGASCYGGRVNQCARNVFDSGAIADSEPNQ